MGYTINGYPLEKMLAAMKDVPAEHKVPVNTFVELLEIAVALEKSQVTFVNQNGEKCTRINNVGTLNL